MADFTSDKKYNYLWQNSKFKDFSQSGSLVSQFINDAGYVTSSTAVSASYALTASYLLGTVTSASNATSASYALTASYVRNAVSASYATNALSASYAANGGVTQLLAGPNVTLSPTNGLGQVTVSATLSGSTIFNTATGSYGSFYDTTTQTNVASTARSMSFNTTDISNGVSISGSTSPFNTYIKTQNAGVYDIQFSAQVDKTDSGTDEIWIWLRKNGSNLNDTATSLQLVGNGAHYVAAWNWFVNSAANDYYQIMWYSPDANVRLHAEAGFGVVPGIPSVILTANRVDQFLSNTGSFSGSFTGTLTGTSSYATQALSASFAPSTPTFPFTGSALITGSLGVTGSYSSRLVSPSAYLWQTHFSGERFDSTTLQGKVYIKTNYPFVEDFYIGKNNGSANNDTSTSAGIHYSHTGQFTVRNTQTSGFYGVTLNADQNLEQRVGIDTGRNGFGFGWSLRNFTNSTDYINFANNSNRVGIGWNDKTTSLLGATLDVKATGSLSTDIAFRVRNSANTQNLMSITGDGRVAIGLNAQILGTTDAYKNVVIGGGAKDISAAGVTENAVAFGYNAVSNNSGTAIGANTSITGIEGVAIGASAIAGISSTAIGKGARADGTSGYQSLAIGYGARASALLSGIIAVGQASYTNALGQTLAFCVDPAGANSQTILLTNKANLIFRNSTQLTSGTHWDTTATNTLTIHSGSIPITNISNSFQLYSSASVAGNVSPHFRTEAGNIIKLYQQTSSIPPSTFVTNTSLIANDTATFDGYTIGQVVKALRNLGILA